MDKIKVLIAEDSATQAMQLQHILEKNGYDATVVSNGSEALRSIKKSKPLIVISDIIMPEMDGYELCRQIKSNESYRDISVILLTSLSQPQVVIWALQCGADKFLTKPCDENHLISTIQHLNENLNSQYPPQKAINISYRGETYFIDSTRSQIINLLLSTYEAAVNKNLELIEAQNELNKLNQGLEEIVDQRTAALRAEIVERERTAVRARLAREVLELLNRSEGSTDTVRDILQLIKKNTGFEAVAIRLREGDDFPYYETNGFSEEFIQAERYLCARDEEGKIIRDGQGKPVLECMCGNILCNRTDPALPFFTEGGSFWSNCTTELLASTTEEDRQAQTRNRCNGEGYESVALIPLRSGDELIGLFQLNDRRRNQFTLQMIQFFEGLGASIGIALSRKRAEEEARKHSAELIEKNEELRAMAQQLWQAAKLATMGELSASIAHELNNPLATVSMRAESLLTKTQQDSPMWRELKIIEQEVERMATLIANLLQFSRRSQPQKSTVDICEETEKALELIYYHLRKRNIVIWREFAKEAPCILADRQQLRQLFLNLFTNASDAMPRGGTLTVRVYTQGSGVRDQETGVTPIPKGEAFVIIEVADTGTGIPPDILPKVTDPFYTTKPEGEGTGLGLAICRRIVQEHNGTFDLTSEGIPGKGTTARISLPVTSGTNAAELK